MFSRWSLKLSKRILPRLKLRPRSRLRPPRSRRTAHRVMPRPRPPHRLRAGWSCLRRDRARSTRLQFCRQRLRQRPTQASRPPEDSSAADRSLTAVPADLRALRGAILNGRPAAPREHRGSSLADLAPSTLPVPATLDPAGPALQALRAHVPVLAPAPAWAARPGPALAVLRVQAVRRRPARRRARSARLREDAADGRSIRRRRKAR